MALEDPIHIKNGIAAPEAYGARIFIEMDASPLSKDELIDCAREHAFDLADVTEHDQKLELFIASIKTPKLQALVNTLAEHDISFHGRYGEGSNIDRHEFEHTA